MATTVNVVVLKHHQKKDGTFNVKIRVTHERVTRYLDTKQYVLKKDLNRHSNLKVGVVHKPVLQTVERYRDIISELDEKLVNFSCDDLIAHLQDEIKPINFIDFGWQHVAELEHQGRKGSAGNFKTVLRFLTDYFGRDAVLITEINSQMLKSYEKFLKTPRTLERQSRFGSRYTLSSAGLSDSGLSNHMRDLRGLFNVARNTYNDEDMGIIRIKHYPFKSYKVPKPPETRKRNLSPEGIKKVRDHQTIIEDGRVELARDIFMLSFYLCGTNAVDFYYMSDINIVNGRLEYKRRKTKGKRRDQAFISIKIVDEAKPLVDRYIGKLQQRFSSHSDLSTAISQGFRKFRTIVGEPDLSLYWARHSFATLARNVCRKSKDDVALALNHVDEGRKTTDIYIQKDWAIIDEVQKAVVSLIRPEETPMRCSSCPPSLILNYINLPDLQRQSINKSTNEFAEI